MIMIKRRTWNITLIGIPYVISTLVFLYMLNVNVNVDVDVETFTYFSLCIGIVVTQIVAGVAIIDELKSATKISLRDYLSYLAFLVPIINAIIVYAAIVYCLGCLIKKVLLKLKKIIL